MLARLLVAALWLFHWLPLGVQSLVGRGFGALLYAVATKRRKVALAISNSPCRSCPRPSARRWRARTFGWLARSILERGLLWFASRARLERLIHVEGDVGPGQALGTAGDVAGASFRGLDVAGMATQLFTGKVGGSIYQSQSNKVMDAVIRRGRLRFGDSILFSRSDSAKPIIRAIKNGYAFFNLPDMDFGERDAAFVPFFGVDAATLLAPSRMAKALNMVCSRWWPRCCPAGGATRALPRAAEQLPDRRCAGRHGRHEPLDRVRDPPQPGAISVGAQALQDAPGRRAGLLLKRGSGHAARGALAAARIIDA